MNNSKNKRLVRERSKAKIKLVKSGPLTRCSDPLTDPHFHRPKSLIFNGQFPLGVCTSCFNKAKVCPTCGEKYPGNGAAECQFCHTNGVRHNYAGI